MLPAAAVRGRQRGRSGPFAAVGRATPSAAMRLARNVHVADQVLDGRRAVAAGVRRHRPPTEHLAAQTDGHSRHARLSRPFAHYTVGSAAARRGRRQRQSIDASAIVAKCCRPVLKYLRESPVATLRDHAEAGLHGSVRMWCHFCCRSPTAPVPTVRTCRPCRRIPPRPRRNRRRTTTTAPSRSCR